MLITDASVTAIHFLGFMTLFATQVALHLSINDKATATRNKRMKELCFIFIGAWIVTLAAGLLKVFWLAPSALYLKNGLFHMKVTLFFAMMILFVPLCVKLIRGFKLPVWIKHTLRLNLLLIVISTILATLIARGIGYLGA